MVSAFANDFLKSNLATKPILDHVFEVEMDLVNFGLVALMTVLQLCHPSVHDNQDAQAVATLLQAQEVSMGLSIFKGVDKEGWEALARAVQGFGASPKTLDHVWVSLEGAAEANREDIRAVWEALESPLGFIVWRNDEDLPSDGDSHQGLVGVGETETWEELERILNMTEEELCEEYENVFC